MTFTFVVLNDSWIIRVLKNDRIELPVVPIERYMIYGEVKYARLAMVRHENERCVESCCLVHGVKDRIQSTEKLRLLLSSKLRYITSNHASFNLKVFQKGGDLRRNNILFKLKVHITTRTSWTWMVPALTCRREKETVTNKLEMSALKTALSLSREVVVVFGGSVFVEGA